MSYPMDCQIFWKNILHLHLAIYFGIITTSVEILGGIELTIGRLSP